MKGRWIFFSLVFFVPVYLIGQFNTSIHFTVKDGLPSSTTYSATQDSFGFIWIGTEAGLVRFDGARFKVFTTQDGLPDNEILGVFYDKVSDRLWVISYSRSACYYKAGKFFSPGNDSSLLKIKCEFGEFINGNMQPGVGMFLYNAFSIYTCTRDSVIKNVINYEGIIQAQKWSDSTTDLLFCAGVMRYDHGVLKGLYHGNGLDSLNKKGKWIGNNLFLYFDSGIKVYERSQNSQYIFKGEIKLDGQSRVSNIIVARGQYVMAISGKGVYAVDTGLSQSPRRIWKGGVNDVMCDRQGNIWVLTNDDGIYAVINSELVNYNSNNGIGHDNITALYFDTCGTLFIGNTQGELFVLKGNILSQIKAITVNNLEKARSIRRVGNKLFFATNNLITYCDLAGGPLKTFSHISGGPKSLLIINEGKEILVGLLATIIKINTKTDETKEFAFHKRIIDMAQHPDGRVFCASLDGMYVYESDTLTHVDNKDQRLNSRITSLCFTRDSLLWIGTPAKGILGYDGKKILINISQAGFMGYHGTICRKIAPGKPGEIWVATNYGINRIQYHYKDSLILDNITPLNMTDGLLSDDVNDIVVRDSLVYVATSHGLTVLNNNRMISTVAIPIYITAVRINDQDSAIHAERYDLSYSQNDIEIEYVGILQPVAGDIRYQYRLLGSGDDRWETTGNTSIDFRSLSPGIYTFQVVALDKFGNRSTALASIQFRISQVFYKTIWFWAVMFIFVLGLGFYLIRRRFRIRQRQFEKEQSLNHKIIELEQQALKAQMNPHFIFNCLTAVQHFVNREDLYSANMYLSNFAKLIRKTLDLSGEQYISLDKEVAYLKSYIGLEKMRFQDKFEYRVTVAPEIDEYGVQVPPMLLQPIIENAIRHGLRNMDTDTGLLRVDFVMDGDKLICTIDDNGVGMKKAAELKTTTHVEYQSKGMKLTMARIHAINMMSEKKITIEIVDKYDDNNEASGTLFILSFEQ